MDPASLLDYALGRLEGPRREQLEQQVANDPALAERLARLIRNLSRLLDDGQGRFPGESTPVLPMREGSVSRGQFPGQGDRPASEMP